MWRAEAYKQAGNDIIERPWIGLTEEDWKQIWDEFDSLDTENDFQDYMAGKYGAGHYTDAGMYWQFQQQMIKQMVNAKLKEKAKEIQDMYTAPREWIGLTDEEIQEFIGPVGETPIRGYTRRLFDQIEAKLKEKNR
jgi:hypothetical protein